MTPFDGFNTVINVLMGTGPIMLPPAIALAGYSFSMIIMLIIGLFSIITGEFMIEVLKSK